MLADFLPIWAMEYRGILAQKGGGGGGGGFFNIKKRENLHVSKTRFLGVLAKFGSETPIFTGSC